MVGKPGWKAGGSGKRPGLTFLAVLNVKVWHGGDGAVLASARTVTATGVIFIALLGPFFVIFNFIPEYRELNSF